MKNKNKKKKVAVVGLWHLGTSVSACLAKVGFKVNAIDFDSKVISGLKKGVIPVFDPGLKELVVEDMKNKNLYFYSDPSKIRNCQYVVLAYDTPVDEHDRVDTAVIFKIVKNLKKHLTKKSTLIIMSQVPVETTRQIENIVCGKNNPKEVEVIYNPENLRLGNAIKTFLEADRQILGVKGKEGERRARDFYQFFKGSLQFMSWESAEMVKHGINSYMACCISFINQITDVAEAVGGNINDIVAGMRSDGRIGKEPRINPGLGFAGATLGRDVRVLEALAKKYKLDLSLISNIYNVNRARIFSVYKKIKNIYPNLKGKKISIFGLVYKPGTDTLRRSLAIEVANRLKQDGAIIHGYDPILKKSFEETKKIHIFYDPYQAVEASDLLLLVTEWPEFLNLEYENIFKLMRNKILYDPKNMLSKEKIISLGFKYYGTGI